MTNNKFHFNPQQAGKSHTTDCLVSGKHYVRFRVHISVGDIFRRVLRIAKNDY
jgi:hypothetical protein